ncbi:tetratricopeptide repeat-containing sensor histidine kinase [Mucilaginibacter antarcticus]|uniref:tetratricopeptide repeat-containing sensor histidine kinase n=1 Tax=Mucilaginibacter antarcticus TaxID=1855725 RepID=UPI0036377850
MGKLYADKGDNVKALNHYHQAQSGAEKIADKNLLAHVYKNIGALYISWKKFEEALAYYDKGELIAASINEDELVADCQNNKGTVYEQQKKYDMALAVYKNALKVYTKKNIPAKISMVLSNLAIVYKFKKDFGASLQYNLKALALSEKSNDKWIMAATYNNIGGLYSAMNNYQQAIMYATKSKDLATKIDAIEIIETAYETMADAASKAGDYKNAYLYHQQFMQSKDKFINLESTKQLSELNVKYETAKKQKLIQQQQLEILRRNMTIMVIAIVFLAALVIGYQIYTRDKLNQKTALQEAAIKHQAMATKAIIEAEENERKRIASDLHDGVGQLFSAVKLNLSGLLCRANLSDPAMVTLGDKTLAMVDESCKEVRLIAHQMMPGSLLQNGLTTAIEDFVKKIDSYHLKIDVKAHNMEGRLDSDIETVLYRIVQESVNNVIKHSQASKLDIILTRDEKQIAATIKDNGRGFNTADRKYFDGIGIKNIITRAAYLKGRVDIFSEETKGTLIAIFIPLGEDF